MSPGAVTRLLGRLEVRHSDGRITFHIRNDREILKRGTNLILTIENAGMIPFLENGRTLKIDCTQVGLDVIHAKDAGLERD
jgi:hypothetical protein